MTSADRPVSRHSSFHQTAPCRRASSYTAAILVVGTMCSPKVTKPSLCIERESHTKSVQLSPRPRHTPYTAERETPILFRFQLVQLLDVLTFVYPSLEYLMILIYSDSNSCANP